MNLPKYIDHPCRECGAMHPRINPAWLRSVREQTGLSLRKFADQAGLSAAYLSDVERGNRSVTCKIEALYAQHVPVGASSEGR